MIRIFMRLVWIVAFLLSIIGAIAFYGTFGELDSNTTETEAIVAFAKNGALGVAIAFFPFMIASTLQGMVNAFTQDEEIGLMIGLLKSMKK